MSPTVHEQSVERLAELLASRTAHRGEIDMATCPGCIGRGTGTRCCMCDGTIPEELRRTPDSPNEVRADCVGCQRGAVHTH
ncbi:hypothetical protein ACFFMN_34115 [Planobispora siamensis]|uniref:Uncharacterized protein n=1 Tax=Planobispora siamensis TaxID=936338 RepID=A0A8J3WJV2_9ACTN|nr:hypothetical protein [Planobispora siamensis]GIH91910.1 hypothetical protein Psi01_25400 [Planobispora siamensis]